MHRHVKKNNNTKYYQKVYYVYNTQMGTLGDAMMKRAVLSKSTYSYCKKIFKVEMTYHEKYLPRQCCSS